MANLIEIEINKFSTVYQIIKEEEPPVELDAEIMVKKLLERGVKPYDAITKSSPILSQVLISNLNKMEDLFSDVNRGQDFNNSHQILEQERQIFIYRLALINSWGIATLDEISSHSQQVYSFMDDWIVDAVAQENYLMQ